MARQVQSPISDAPRETVRSLGIRTGPYPAASLEQTPASVDATQYRDDPIRQ